MIRSARARGMGPSGEQPDRRLRRAERRQQQALLGHLCDAVENGSRPAPLPNNWCSSGSAARARHRGGRFSPRRRVPANLMRRAPIRACRAPLRRWRAAQPQSPELGAVPARRSSTWLAAVRRDTRSLSGCLQRPGFRGRSNVPTRIRTPPPTKVPNQKARPPSPLRSRRNSLGHTRSDEQPAEQDAEPPQPPPRAPTSAFGARGPTTTAAHRTSVASPTFGLNPWRGYCRASAQPSSRSSPLSDVRAVSHSRVSGSSRVASRKPPDMEDRGKPSEQPCHPARPDRASWPWPPRSAGSVGYRALARGDDARAPSRKLARAVRRGRLVSRWRF